MALDIKQLRKDLLRSLKTPKRKLKRRLGRRKTVLPLNYKVVSGVNEVINTHFEVSTLPKFRNHKSQSISNQQYADQDDNQSQDSTVRILELLQSEKKRILKPSKTLHEKIIAYLNKVRQKESIRLPKQKKKTINSCRPSMAISPNKAETQKYKQVDTLISNCEKSKELYNSEKRILNHKIKGVNKNVGKYYRQVERVISKNNQMNHGDYEFINKEEKERRISTNLINKLQSLYSKPAVH